MRLPVIPAWLHGLGFMLIMLTLFAAGGAVGFRWDPFNMTQRRAERAETQLATARVDIAARSAEIAGARATTRLVERAAADRADATAIVHRYALQLEAFHHDATPDDATPDPDHGADLRTVIGQLCGLRPTVCTDPDHSAPPRNAHHGASALPDSRPAG